MEKEITERVFMNSEVPKPLAKKARITAAHLGISRSALVRLAVSEYLEKLEVRLTLLKESQRERSA